MTEDDRRELRETIADEIDRLLGIIDMLDGDPDLEPEEDFGIEDVSHDTLPMPDEAEPWGLQRAV